MASDVGSKEFEGATFVRTSFRGATLRSCDVSRGGIRGAARTGIPPVGDCVRVILEEEWAHLRDVRRDLALLG